MIDPLTPLFQIHDAVAAAMTPNAADPQSALAVMFVGIIIVIVTAGWAVGGLSAAACVLIDRRERRLHVRGAVAGANRKRRPIA